MLVGLFELQFSRLQICAIRIEVSLQCVVGLRVARARVRARGRRWRQSHTYLDTSLKFGQAVAYRGFRSAEKRAQDEEDGEEERNLGRYPGQHHVGIGLQVSGKKGIRDEGGREGIADDELVLRWIAL